MNLERIDPEELLEEFWKPPKPEQEKRETRGPGELPRDIGMMQYLKENVRWVIVLVVGIFIIWRFVVPWFFLRVLIPLFVLGCESGLLDCTDLF